MRERERERERLFYNQISLKHLLSPSNFLISLKHCHLALERGESQKCEAKNNTPQILLLVLGFVFINHQD